MPWLRRKTVCNEGSVSDVQEFQERLLWLKNEPALELIQKTVFDERTAEAVQEKDYQ